MSGTEIGGNTSDELVRIRGVSEHPDCAALQAYIHFVVLHFLQHFS